MKFFSANLNSLRKLYTDQLQQLYSAEKQIIEALPKMIEAASDSDLKDALEAHLEETRGHVARLEEILQETMGAVESKKNKGVAALLAEGEDVITDASDESVRDVGIIAAAQKVERYEIAAYGTVRSFAEIMGETEQADLLATTLDEEKHADEVLTEISDLANIEADKAA